MKSEEKNSAVNLKLELYLRYFVLHRSDQFEGFSLSNSESDYKNVKGGVLYPYLHL